MSESGWHSVGVIIIIIKRISRAPIIIIIIKRISRAPIYHNRWQHWELYNNTNHTHTHLSLIHI